MNPIVVGICHDGDGSFLNPYSHKRFVQEICPLVTDNALLILEGGYRRHVIHKSHPKYVKERKAVERFLGVTLSSSPSFAWRDARMFPFHRAVLGTEFGEVLENILSRIPQPGLSCNTIAELLRRIEDGVAPHISTKRRLSHRQKVVLWNNGREMREFDRRVIATAKQFKDVRDVFIICGLAHALAIAHGEGWTLKPLIKDTRAGMLHTLRVYHTSYVLPQYFPLRFR